MDELVRDILEAACVRDGISLDSAVEPGTPARNYELALRLGIGGVFGIEPDPVPPAHFDEHDLAVINSYGEDDD